MTKNEGAIDRALRIIAGAALLYFGFLQMAGIWGVIVGIIGVVLLATGAIGWCPAYLPFGINTSKST